jgi:hypothetical protein
MYGMNGDMKQIKFVFLIIFILTYGKLFCQTPVNIDRAIQNSVNQIYASLPNNTTIFVYDIQSDYPDLSKYITDNLISSITNDRRKNVIGLNIVERNNQILNAINEEINFQYSGEVSDETAISLGKRLGAEIIIIGDSLFIGNNLSLHIRIIHIETARILIAINENIKDDKKVRAMTSEENRQVIRNRNSFSLYNKDFLQNRLYLGAHVGFSPNIYKLNTNADMTAENFVSFDAGLQFGVRISKMFILQTELNYSTDEVIAEGNNTILLKTHSLTIPIIAKFHNMNGNFYYSFFGGLYYPISLGEMEVNINGYSENYDYYYPFGFLLGFNLGWKVGPGVIFSDIRFLQDLGYVYANNADQYLRTGFNFSIGYNFPLWGIK